MMNPRPASLPRMRPFLTALFAFVASFLGAAPAANWEQTGWGGGGYFYAAAYHPTKKDVIYMAGDVAGVYKSEDNGKNWRMINNGIAGYAVFSLAVDRRNPDTVFAATENGLSKSTDAGETWQIIPRTGKNDLRITGEKKKSIRSIAVDPSNGNVVYAGTPLGKVYKSVDGGLTWHLSYEKKSAEEPGVQRIQFGKVNNGYFGVYSMPVSLPESVNASDISGVGFTLQGDGSLPNNAFVIVRIKGGATYRSKNLNTIYQETAWRDIVLAPGDFALDSDYLKRNPDAATTQPATPDLSRIARLEMTCSGALPNTAVVSKVKRFFFTHAGGQAPILDFASPSAAASLQLTGNVHVGSAISAPISGVAVSASNPAWVAAASYDSGILLSKDGGRTWTELDTPKKASTVVFDPANPNVIYGSFFTDGVHKSSDGGRTWTSLSRNWKEKYSIMEVALNPANPREIYALSSFNWAGIVYSSKDGGQTWKTATRMTVDLSANPTLDNVNRAANDSHISAPSNITINPHNPKELFMSANWRPAFSSDGGLTWTERDRGADISCAHDIRFHKGKTYVSSMDEGTMVSDDHGKNWRQIWPLKYDAKLSGHNWRVAITEVNGADRILIGSSPWGNNPVHVVRSDDSGKTFNVVKDGLPDYVVRPNTMWGQGYPRALAVDPNNPAVVYLGIDGDPADGKMGGGIFKSTDGGATWNQLPNQPDSRRMFYGLAVDPTDSKRLFWGASARNGGLYVSNDGGDSWTRANLGESWIWNIHVTKDGTVYCSGQQLWRSTDGGRTWTRISNFPQQPRALVGIEVHPRDPGTIWITRVTWDFSSNGEIYKTTDGGTTWTDITGNIPYRKPLVLRFNPETNELWAGGVGLYKLKQ
jgi:photosystem II stability/assembly factor-like uncharacterized protein